MIITNTRTGIKNTNSMTITSTVTITIITIANTVV